MLFLRERLSHSRCVWLVTGILFLLKSLFIMLTPMRGLASTTWLIDDSFIEMRVARNLALGGGFSLDGLHSTTGAPFFWIYLTSLNHLFLGKEAAIRATLLESTLLGALATVVVFHIALKLTEDRRVAWTAFLLSALTANAFLNAMNGMDTALFTLAVLLSIAAYFGIGKTARWSPFAWGCVIGAAAGITIMTRGDGLFLLLGLVCLKLYEWWAAPERYRREHVQSLLGILLLSGLCFAVFMGWQLAQTGSPFPGNQVGRRGLALALHNFSFDRFSLSRYLSIVVWNVFQLWDLLTIATGGALLALAAFVSGSLGKRLRPLALISWIYLGVFFALLVSYQWYFADFHGLRYINPAAHILFIFVALFLWQLPIECWKEPLQNSDSTKKYSRRQEGEGTSQKSQDARKQAEILRGVSAYVEQNFGAVDEAACIFQRFRKKGAIGLLTVSILVLAGYKHYQIASRAPVYRSYIGHPDLRESRKFWGVIDWMRDNLSPETIVGVRDYGRVSMFTDVRIQDLAGNIDPKVPIALNNGTLKDYLKARNVQYLFIPTLEMRQDKLYQYLHGQMHLEPVAAAPKGPAQVLYKIIW